MSFKTLIVSSLIAIVVAHSSMAHAQSIMSQINAANAAGEDVAALVTKILNEASPEELDRAVATAVVTVAQMDSATASQIIANVINQVDTAIAVKVLAAVSFIAPKTSLDIEEILAAIQATVTDPVKMAALLDAGEDPASIIDVEATTFSIAAGFSSSVYSGVPGYSDQLK
ncbi:MAG: hypothetical protein OEL75_04360 [Kiritimatiellaceae bacterium]|nr:hypothetical protein [Kiritimatiellaceae bacterium]